ncbi:hypothetical protein [Aeromicrobium stalagmiti]|uniref:hypothetical protein n=1 Tax=Aeromicrobium stalagmiti TaxID=2738988 RepID=UPI00156A0682|nr:hypothetical protein [Aeromicrobium stalagmiti]NRQ49205.1 hypothetical protein [Aeromicrobium stalagmiti]
MWQFVGERPTGMSLRVWVSAMTTARASDKRVEDLSKRTETTRTFANPDGTLTDEQFGASVRVMDETDGTWQDVDSDLTRQADGSWVPKVSPVDVRINGGGAQEASQPTSCRSRLACWSR